MSKKNLFFLILVFNTIIGHTQIINTIAGNGTAGYSGDGGNALAANIGECYGIAADNSGNVYFSDYEHHVIRKINSAGIITTIAGTGTAGYSGDGGPASLCQLNQPMGVSVDNIGNIYIIDQLTKYIRKINSSGIISTIAGTPMFSCAGDGGPATAAWFTSISGVFPDNLGNLYVSDAGCGTVRKINSAGIITAFAGTGTPSYSGDGGPATAAQLNDVGRVGMDQAGNIYIPDKHNGRIRMVNTSGIISTVCGNGLFIYSGDGGPASAATLGYVTDVVFDPFNNYFIADPVAFAIRKVNAAGIINAYTGNLYSAFTGDGGPAIAAQISMVDAIATDNAGNLYLADSRWNYRIRKITTCQTAIINQQPANQSVCNTGNASFSVDATNITSWQWQVNTGSGWNDITDNSDYAGTNTNNLVVNSAAVFMNTYQYRCALINGCSVIFSDAAKLTVSTMVTPALSIAASAIDICAGATVNFNASAINAGTSPVYQWKKNGMNTGTNSSSYSDNNLNSGDLITCMVTVTGGCVSTNTANSNSIAMTVTPKVTSSVSITASTDNICQGEPVTFTSASVNTGAAPAYTWFVNGTNLLLNSPTYTVNTLNDGDYVMCVMKSSLACLDYELAVSLPIIIHVNPLAAPAITVTASKASICKGTPVTFTATPVNGGSLPVYQWKKNGLPVGTGNNTYSDNAIAAGDIISCMLTSNARCLSVPTAASNNISIAILPDPVVVLDHTNTICTGSQRILDAGNFPSYLWHDGSTQQTFTINNTGIYYVTVTDQNGCRGSDTTKISSLSALPSGFAPIDTAICSYGSLILKAPAGYRNYLWNTGTPGSSLTITRPGPYWIEVTDQNNCTARETVNVLPKDCMKGFYIPNSFTPDNNGRNDDFKPLLFGNVAYYRFTIYDRWGQVVFQTSDLSKGWNGTLKGIKKATDVFVWTCTYQFEGEEKKMEKGTVTLIR